MFLWYTLSFTSRFVLVLLVLFFLAPELPTGWGDAKFYFSALCMSGISTFCFLGASSEFSSRVYMGYLSNMLPCHISNLEEKQELMYPLAVWFSTETDQNSIKYPWRMDTEAVGQIIPKFSCIWFSFTSACVNLLLHVLR